MSRKVEQKVYTLLKDLPNVNAGAEIKLSNSGFQYTCKDKHGLQANFNKMLIENNPDWFQEKKPIVEEKVWVSNVNGTKFKHRVPPPKGYQYSYNTFTTTSPIPQDKHEAVKQAIEGVLNKGNKWDKLNKEFGTALESIPTIGRQNSKENKPEWEIMSRVTPNGTVIPEQRHLMFKNYDYFPLPIHSVKILSNNEVFNLEDKTENGKIVSFSIEGEEMIAHFSYTNSGMSCGGFCNIKLIKKFPKVDGRLNLDSVHLSHCYQGEYESSCKYGNDNCPARPKEDKEEKGGFEIQCIQLNNKNYWRQSDGRYSSDLYDNNLHHDYLLIEKGGEVKSYKRLIDNETFVVSELVEVNPNEFDRIQCFYNDYPDDIRIGLKGGGFIFLSQVKKATQREQKPANGIAATENFDFVQKPPIGLMPEKLWIEKRLHEIDAAMNRYSEAGIEIPPELIDEKRNLLQWVMIKMY